MLINSRDALHAAGEREMHLEMSVFEIASEDLPKEIILTEDVKKLVNPILLTIKDNGCGMDEGTLKRVFEPFFTTKPIGQGTGMGMAMAYGTITNHHGAIGIKSQLNEGTEIYIVLPKAVE